MELYARAYMISTNVFPPHLCGCMCVLSPVRFRPLFFRLYVQRRLPFSPPPLPPLRHCVVLPQDDPQQAAAGGGPESEDEPH